MFRLFVIALLGVGLVTACANSQGAPTVTHSVTASAPTPRPATGPGSDQCVPVATLPCPALPAGHWYELNVGPALAECVDGSTGARLTLTDMTTAGENVSGFRTWCVPVSDPTRAGSGLDWAGLFAEVAGQAS